MWPFRKPETETRADYTEAAVKAIIESATGGGPANFKETAAAQAAASLVGRSLAVATVEGSTPARTGFTPALLHDLGCSLILDGEAVYRIDVSEGGTVTLRRASDWDVSGGPDPESWRYRLTLPGPSRNAQVNLPGNAVFHPRINPAAAEPHKGRSPIAVAVQSARLAAGLEKQMANEAVAQSGTLIPAPESQIGEDRLKELKAVLSKLAGKTTFVPSMVGGWNEGKAAAPAGDWRPQRIGFNPPAAALETRTAVERGILAACGIPVTLFDSASQTAAREGLRAFLHSGLQPIADLIAAEATAKLAADIRFGFDRLFASDIQSRARSYAALVGAGMDATAAAKVTGMSDN